MHMFTSLSLTWNRSLPQTMKTVDIKKLREGAEGFSHQELHIWPWIFIGRTDAKAETPIIWPPDVKNWFIGQDPDTGKHWRQKEKGKTEDAVVGWHHQFNGHEFEWAPGVGYGQRSLACCSPWGCKFWTRLSNWTELKEYKSYYTKHILKNMFKVSSFSRLFPPHLDSPTLL